MVPRSISSHPFPWTIVAVLLISILAYLIAGNAGLAFSLMASVSAAVLFLISARLRPMKTQAGT
jgi:hypothetical protein